jgi:hypothetical protein
MADVQPHHRRPGVARRIVFFPLGIVHRCMRLYDEWQEPRKLRKFSKSLHKERAREAPKPLRLKRRRALSLAKTNASASVGCPLLARLPKEIRLQIWQYVLGSGGCHYHLVHGGGRITHALCQSSNHENVNKLPSPCCPSSASRACCDKMLMSHICTTDESCIRQSTNVDEVFEKLPRANSTLLRTCRQIYQDAALLLYSTNIFDVDDLNTFIYWSRTILPSRLAAVRALSISWDIFWPPLTKTDPLGRYTFETACPHARLGLRNSDQVWVDFWDIVATKMPGLQDLRIMIGCNPPYYGVVDPIIFFGKERGLLRDVNALWVKPLLTIRGLKKFELEIIGGGSRGRYDHFSTPVGEDDLELQEKTELFLEDVRRIVCEPSPT